MSRFRPLSALAVVAALAAFATAASAHTALRGGSGPDCVTYRDSIGEDAAAADVATVVVSEWPRRGEITFRVGIRNRPQLTPDVGVQIVLDTDRSVTTGDPYLVRGLGADYLISLFYPSRVQLRRWSPAARAWVAASAVLTASYDSHLVRVTVAAHSLVDLASFDFDVSTAAGIVIESDGLIDITDAHFDFAPDVSHGHWTFVGRPQAPSRHPGGCEDTLEPPLVGGQPDRPRTH